MDERIEALLKDLQEEQGKDSSMIRENVRRPPYFADLNQGLKEVADARNMTLSDLISSIDAERKQANLSSAIRPFILDFHRKHLEEVAARDIMAKRPASTA
jgi:3'-phosphoadenosine 5'-phosphosulfate sulfotransferase